MYRSLILPMALGIALGLSGCGGGSDPVLAEVGSGKITAADFQAAYVNMRPQDRPALDTDQAREKFLNDLVSKEIMELCALELYPELAEQQQWRLKRFRDTTLTGYIKDFLFKKQAVVTGAMKDTVFQNLNRDLDLLAMLIVDPDEAVYVREQLDTGADFISLARDHSNKFATDDGHGVLGWERAGQNFPYYVDVEVWKAEVGSTVGPFHTPQGSYIVRILDEREGQPEADRETMDGLLNQWILEPIYLDRQKAVKDSLYEAADPFYSAEAKALLTLKYYWQIPPELADDPMAKLNAERVVPTFTAEEAEIVVVEFADGETWTATEFAERLSWFPVGLWPDGQSEEGLLECLTMMMRDYLYIKAARDLGFENEEFEQVVENKAREMRVNYFYYNNLMPQFEPNQAEIDSFFQAERTRYRAPDSYKIAFFGTINEEIINALHQDWLGGMSFVQLREKYEPMEPALVALGETEWLYSGQDIVRDETVATLKEGGICTPLKRNDLSMVFKLVARRPSRMLSYGEIKEVVDKDATTLLSDLKLSNYLAGRRDDFGVKLYLENLSKVVLPDA